LRPSRLGGDRLFHAVPALLIGARGTIRGVCAHRKQPAGVPPTVRAARCASTLVRTTIFTRANMIPDISRTAAKSRVKSQESRVESRRAEYEPEALATDGISEFGTFLWPFAFLAASR
jgi:hypothetical protein